MNNSAPQQFPTPPRLYLADVLAELAGPDLDVELDALLSDEDLPLTMRQEIAQKREDLITETRRRILELSAAIDKRHRIHADRAGYEQARKEAEERRAEEQRRAEERREAERLMLNRARRRAEALGFTLEPIRVLHQTAAQPYGRGYTSEQLEERRWRITAPLDHPAVEHTRDNLIRTQDGKSVELSRNTLRGCCEWLSRQAAVDGDDNREHAPTPEPRGKLLRRRRDTP